MVASVLGALVEVYITVLLSIEVVGGIDLDVGPNVSPVVLVGEDVIVCGFGFGFRSR